MPGVTDASTDPTTEEPVALALVFGWGHRRVGARHASLEEALRAAAENAVRDADEG